jgi:hypothetical protein
MNIEKCEVHDNLMVSITINGLPEGLESSQFEIYIDGKPQGTPTLLGNELSFQATADQPGRLYVKINLGAEGEEKLSTDYTPPSKQPDQPKEPPPQVNNVNPTTVDCGQTVSLRGKNLINVKAVRLGTSFLDQPAIVSVANLSLSFKVLDNTLPGTHRIFLKTPAHG